MLTKRIATGGTRHKVAKIDLHPNYNNNTMSYDIAVITLKTPAVVSAYATLITPAQEKTLAKNGTSAYVVGWGSTIKAGGGYPKDLMQVALPLVAHAICNAADGGITARMICTRPKAGGKDS